MAQRLGFLSPGASLVVPAGADADMRIAVPGRAGFDAVAFQGSIDRRSLETLATSPIRVRQFDLQRWDTGRLVGLVQGTPNFYELFGQGGDSGAVPLPGGEPIDRASTVLIALRNVDVVNHTIDVTLRGTYDTDKTPQARERRGVKPGMQRSFYANGRVTLPGTVANEELEIIIRTPGVGPFTLMGVSGFVNDIPFGAAGIVPVLVTSMKIQRPGAGAEEELVVGVIDFNDFAGQNGKPALMPIHESIVPDTDITVRVRNVSAPLAAQAVSLTLIGVVTEGPPVTG